MIWTRKTTGSNKSSLKKVQVSNPNAVLPVTGWNLISHADLTPL